MISPQPEPADQNLLDGDVVIDVVFETGLLFLELVNLGRMPALDVRCNFREPLTGIDGSDITNLPLFDHVPLLLPGKRIRTLLDASASYFARNDKTTITATVHYQTPSGARHQTTVRHNLDIY